MSNFGNGGCPNSMKLGEDIDLDVLLLNTVLFVFVLSSFNIFSFLGPQSTKNTHMRVLGFITIKAKSLRWPNRMKNGDIPQKYNFLKNVKFKAIEHLLKAF